MSVDELMADARKVWATMNPEPESPAVESVETESYEAPIEAVETVDVLEAAPVPIQESEPVAEFFAAEIADHIAALEAENAELRRLAMEATESARAALSAAAEPQLELDVLNEIAALLEDLRNEELENLRREVVGFRKDIGRRRRRWWWFR